MPKVIIRRSPPTKLDFAPYDTQCVIINSQNIETDRYKQVNLNEEDPIWEKVDK